MDLKLSNFLGPAVTPGAGTSGAATTAADTGGPDFAAGLALMMDTGSASASGAGSPLSGLMPAATRDPGSAARPDADAALSAMAELLGMGFAAEDLLAGSATVRLRTAKLSAAEQAASALPEANLLAALAALMAATQSAVPAKGGGLQATEMGLAAGIRGDAVRDGGPQRVFAMAMALIPRDSAGVVEPGESGMPIPPAALPTMAARLSALVAAGGSTPLNPALPAVDPQGMAGGSGSPLAAPGASAALPASNAVVANLFDVLAAQFGAEPPSAGTAGLGIVAGSVADPVGATVTVATPSMSIQGATTDRVGLPAASTAPLEIRHPQAPQQLAESVMWHLDQGAQEVRIRVNPEALGPLEVKLRLDGEKVAVRFDMADASVRDVVQTSLPQLSSMLAARGLALDQAQVFSQDRGQPQPQGESFAQNPHQRHEEQDAPAGGWRRAAHLGAVDDYA